MDSKAPKRKFLRLKDYDYSQAGAYFLTLCTEGRACLFGEAADTGIELHPAGRMAQAVWKEMPEVYNGVCIDAFVVMPNHIHGVLLLGGSSRSEPGVAAGGGLSSGISLSIPDLVLRYKTLTTNLYSKGVREDGWRAFRSRLWQRGYFEHVIRSSEALRSIRQYIAENPARWQEDHENPKVSRVIRENRDRRMIFEDGQARGPAPTKKSSVQ